MTQHEDHTPEGEETPADVNAGPKANKPSGPAPQAGQTAPNGEESLEESLTVEDILGEAQSDEAKSADGAAAGTAAQGEDSEANAAEDNPYLDDLRRITAEYANYRKRTEANVEIDKQRAKASVISSLLTVLDDLDRAEAHGDLTEGSAFATIAQKIRSALERLGLEGFGEQGEDFDPQIHEAIAQVPVPGTEQHTVLDVVERGYRIGDVELRPAKVAVAVAADG